MTRIIKYSLIKFLPERIVQEKEINSLRIYNFNNKQISDGMVVYLMEREMRLCDNFALQFALKKASELNRLLEVICCYPKFKHSKKQFFIDSNIKSLENSFKKTNINFRVVCQKDVDKILKEYDIGLLIIDFCPIAERNYLKNKNYKIFEIDGHNIIPARIVSSKQEYSAATMRNLIYKKIYSFFTEYDNFITEKTEASDVLSDFININLSKYNDLKNNPSVNVLSGLSKYLNFGFISSQRVALEVIQSDNAEINKEVFLEELIVRKELADNFCLYCKNYKTFNCIPLWAKKSLNNHTSDIRTYIYSSDEFENAKTHDELWNATQTELLKTGCIHGYLRMYWAKKIFEWSVTPEEALKFAIYLNDKYAFDAPGSSGYVNILWALGALHDRAFQDTFVTGKIRRMTYNSLKRKINIDAYIQRINSL